MKRLFLLAALLWTAAAVRAREVYPLNDGWQFFFKTENDSGNARFVSLPHTWDTDPTAGAGFLETTGTYLNEIYVPIEWSDKRLFLKCYGAQSVADLFVNGAFAGEHRGGGTAFALEITDRIRFGSNNQLQLIVSNNSRSDVLPVSTDINLYGGLYRGVELIVTDRKGISPLYYGTEGVLVYPEAVSAEEVRGEIEVRLTGDAATDATLDIELRSDDDKILFSREQRLRGKHGGVQRIPFSFRYPMLWSPEQPNLYRVIVRFEEGGCRDSVTVRTGFRRIAVDPATGRLTLNGEPVRLRGVVLHHDNTEGGMPKAADYDEDLRIVQDLGATAIRSAVMPHGQYLYDRCDEMGLLAWIDAPLHRAPYVGEMAYFSTPLFEQNAEQQLREIILQHQNHPSVVMWGLFSRLAAREERFIDLLKRFNEMAHRLDPTRPTVACSDQDGAVNFITDLIVWRQEVGWQRGSAADLDLWRDQLATNWSHLHSAIGYGGEGFLGMTQRRLQRLREQPLPTEERQARFHEAYCRQLDGDTLFWGTWIENLFEYGAARRPYGLDGHGLVTLNRREKKDAYYLYRALWNTAQPTLHLTGRRQRLRLDERQHFTVYSSAGDPVLTVGDDTVALHRYAPCQYRSDTIVLTGHVPVRVSAGGYGDGMTIQIGNALKPKPTTAPRRTADRRRTN